jgi:predicted transcriptional regulator
VNDQRRLIEPQCHEFQAHWNINEHGLRPWFDADAQVKRGDGSISAEFDALGETWNAELYYQESAIQPPADATPAGTTIEHETIREFRIHVEAADGSGERKANFHIRPRFRGMEAKSEDGSRTEISVPESLANEHTDAVNIRINGSNIPFDEFGTVLRNAAAAVGVDSYYFREQDRHTTSSIQDAARYVRLHTDVSGNIHSRTGPLVKLAHVLENDRRGYRKLVENDEDFHGRNLPGFYHTATIDAERAQEVMPNHRLPVEGKHYYAKEALARPMDDPLRHPKLEFSYQQSRWDESLPYTDDAINELTTELDEWIYAVLNDAGLSVRATDAEHVSDDYFEAENATTSANVVDLNLTEIRHEQELIVNKHLAGGISPVEGEILNSLVTDGGRKSPQELADENDRDTGTVYAALRRMDDLIERQYADVSLQSTYAAELVADALEHAQTAIARGLNAVADAKEAAERGLDDNTSAFLAWCETHGVEYQEMQDYDGTIDLGEVEDADDARRMLREGKQLWREMNRDPGKFNAATVRFDVYDERNQLRSVESNQRESGHYQTRVVNHAHQILR